MFAHCSGSLVARCPKRRPCAGPDPLVDSCHHIAWLLVEQRQAGVHEVLCAHNPREKQQTPHINTKTFTGAQRPHKQHGGQRQQLDKYLNTHVRCMKRPPNTLSYSFVFHTYPCEMHAALSRLIPETLLRPPSFTECLQMDFQGCRTQLKTASGCVSRAPPADQTYF